MRKWTAIFEDAPQDAVVVEESDDDGIIERFDAAGEKPMTIGDRNVIGMWIEDFATEQIDVIRACGRCPSDIPHRHEECKERSKHAPPIRRFQSVNHAPHWPIRARQQLDCLDNPQPNLLPIQVACIQQRQPAWPHE